MAPVTCLDFDDAVDELAVGAIEEPRRSEFLAHVAECPSCDAKLRALADVADRLLLLSVPADPPAGFESRVLDRVGAIASSPAGRRIPWAAAAAVLVALVAGMLIGDRVGGDGSTSDRVREATIVAVDGEAVGTVSLVDEPRPHVLLTISDPRPGPGSRSCELELASGRRVVVGSWTYEEIETGVWSAGIEASLLEAVSMRVLDGDRVIARAEFD